MCITPQLISKFINLVCEGEPLYDDLEEKESIEETVQAYDYKKGLALFWYLRYLQPNNEDGHVLGI